MKLPTERITITVAEYQLIKPGLDTLANGFANARLGMFPRQHPWHLIDLQASAIYKDQAYDDNMAARVMAVRSKLWGLTQSRKVRLDPFEFAAAAFATRIIAEPQSSRTEMSKSPEMKLLRVKLERYRRRAARAALERVSRTVYRDAADKWLKFVFWCRYNLSYFKMPNPVRFRRAAMWREQRLQLSGIITTILEKNFRENLDEQQMRKTMTLLMSSLRRGRHRVGLRDLLRDPKPHENLLFEFISKRNDLKKLPGAPVPAWQQITDRTDKFNAYVAAKRTAAAAQHAVKRVLPVAAPIAKVAIKPTLSERLAAIRARKTTTDTVDTITKPAGNTHNGVALTGEILCGAMAEWLARVVGSRFDLIRGICRQAQFIISVNLVDQYRRPTVSTSFEGLVQELRPENPFTETNSAISEHAVWLLRVLLALRQEPAWMYWAIGTACGRALLLMPSPSYAIRKG